MKCTNRSNDNNNKIYTINDTFVLLGIQILIELHICDTVRIQSCFCLFYGRVIRKMGRFLHGFGSTNYLKIGKDIRIS